MYGWFTLLGVGWLHGIDRISKKVVMVYISHCSSESEED